MSPPVKRRITAEERVAAYPSRRTADVSSAAARNRKYLLMPVVPIATLIGIALLVALLIYLPRAAAGLALFATWIVSIIDAARRSRPAWVVAIVLFWPTVVAYWTVRLFRLGRA